MLAADLQCCGCRATPLFSLPRRLRASASRFVTKPGLHRLVPSCRRQVIEDVEDDITMSHRIAIMMQVASGMEALAAQKLIHRDLALR